MQRPPPQTNLHVPGAPAVLFVLVGSGWVELRVPQVSKINNWFVMKSVKSPGLVATPTTPAVSSLWHLLQIVQIATGVLPVLNLFLPSLQDRCVGLRVGRVGQSGVTTAKRGPAGQNDETGTSVQL